MNTVFEAEPVAALSAELQAFRGEVTEAIDSLVSGMLDLQDTRLRPLEAEAGRIDRRLQALEQRGMQLQALTHQLNEVAQALALERTCRSLAETSQMCEKARTVVFVGRPHFGCNVKYAWLAALERAEQAGYACWFLPFDAEQEALVRTLTPNCLPSDHRLWSVEHVKLAQHTAVLVIGDHVHSAAHPNPYAPALFKGARWVQLWHGISIKEVGLQYPMPLAGMTPFWADAFASCGRYATFLGSSAGARAEWRRWFSFERYSAVGYPRSDVLLREPTARDLLNVDTDAMQQAQATRRAGGRSVLYVPTFRDNDRGWILNVGLDRLSQLLAERGDTLFVNLHPLEYGDVPALQRRFPAVRFVRGRSDLYPLLREVSVLVTDYSSLMFDFLPMQRPIVFYRPDHERYVSGSRPLYDAKVSRLPGRECRSLDDLLTAFAGDAATLDAPYAALRDELADRLFDRIDDQASARVLDLIEDELALALAADAPR
jgi:CDP-glycerol glycerophosphotransferase